MATEPIESSNGVSLCITTLKAPPTSCTAGAAQLYSDPSSGAGLPLWNVDRKYGIHSLVQYPLISSPLKNGCNDLFLAYAGSSKSDMYAMLISSNHIKWKCRLPEYMTGGLIISADGQYCIGAGNSGQIYLWSLLQTPSGNGTLVKTIKSNYRSITCLKFSQDGEYLLVAGADGILHMYAMVDLLEQSLRGDDIQPRQTWSEHHLQITDLCVLPHGNRVVSSSLDQTLVVMELTHSKVLAKLSMPCGVTRLTTSHMNGSKLYAGGQDGTIYKVDLDVVAMAQTAEMANISGFHPSSKLQDWNKLFDSSTEQPKKQCGITMELYGHLQSISALSCHDNLLVSGDEKGYLRLWNVQSGICTLALRPWGNSSSGAVSSIVFVDNQENRINKTKEIEVDHYIFPLTHHANNSSKNNILIFPRPNIDEAPKSMHGARHEKRVKLMRQAANEVDSLFKSLNPQVETLMQPKNDQDEQISTLKQQLADAQDQIERWQKVNNALMLKLQQR